MTYNPIPAPIGVKIGGGASVANIPNSPTSGSGRASLSGLFPAENALPLSSGGVPPNRLDFNGLFALLGGHQYFLQNGGIYAYSNSLNYDATALVQYNAKVYIALKANGSGTTQGVVTPGTNAEVWHDLSTAGDTPSAWPEDRNIRVGDYEQTNWGATAALNAGTGVFNLLLPERAQFYRVYGSHSTSDTSENSYSLGFGDSAVATGLRVNWSNSNSGEYDRTIASPYQINITHRGVDTNSPSLARVFLSTDDTSLAYRGLFTRSVITWQGVGSESGFYYSGWQVGYEKIQLWASAYPEQFQGIVNDVGTLPPSWSDSTVTVAPHGNDISIPLKGHCTPIISAMGIKFEGFNTIGSTIVACRNVEANVEYGTIVAGSSLRWCGFDNDGGEYQPDISLGLTGSWVKCSGGTSRYGGQYGFGLYRRIL